LLLIHNQGNSTLLTVADASAATVAIAAAADISDTFSAFQI